MYNDVFCVGHFLIAGNGGRNDDFRPEIILFSKSKQKYLSVKKCFENHAKTTKFHQKFVRQKTKISSTYIFQN
jgi:hypothetical protein